MTAGLPTPTVARQSGFTAATYRQGLNFSIDMRNKTSEEIRNRRSGIKVADVRGKEEEVGQLTKRCEFQLTRELRNKSL